MLERTLSMIKPDAVARGLVGAVIGRLEEADFRLVAMRMVRLSQGQAERFYAVHRDRPFFKGLVDFMISGPSVVIVLEGENAVSEYRKIMGATDPSRAEPGTIRRAFGTDGRKNAVHGSDSADSARFEIGFFFSESELIDL